MSELLNQGLSASGWRRLYEKDHAELCQYAARVAALEAERDALQMAVDEAREVEAELLGTIVHLTGEGLEPCGGDCPGHLGEKGEQALLKARREWLSLQAERDRLLRFVCYVAKRGEQDGGFEMRLSAESLLDDRYAWSDLDEQARAALAGEES